MTKKKKKEMEQILSTLLFMQHPFTTLLQYKGRRYYVLEYKVSPTLSYNMNAMPCEKRAVEGELFLECIRKWAPAESRGASRRRGACSKCKTILCHQGNPILPVGAPVGKCFWSWRGEEKRKEEREEEEEEEEEGEEGEEKDEEEAGERLRRRRRVVHTHESSFLFPARFIVHCS